MSAATTELEHFSPQEVEGLTPRMKVHLQALRYMVGIPLCVTSGLRPNSSGEHSEGDGVDLSDNMTGAPISSPFRHKVLKAAYALGFRRIGDYDRHIHIGLSTTRPLDVTWWKTSD